MWTALIIIFRTDFRIKYTSVIWKGESQNYLQTYLKPSIRQCSIFIQVTVSIIRFCQASQLHKNLDTSGNINNVFIVVYNAVAKNINCPTHALQNLWKSSNNYQEKHSVIKTIITILEVYFGSYHYGSMALNYKFEIKWRKKLNKIWFGLEYNLWNHWYANLCSPKTAPANPQKPATLSVAMECIYTEATSRRYESPDYDHFYDSKRSENSTLSSVPILTKATSTMPT